jgi:hypothetical protein
MAKPTTEWAQQHPLPPFTHWDQRGNPVLLTDLELMNRKTLRLSLKTQDPDIARRHMRFLVARVRWPDRTALAVCVVVTNKHGRPDAR